MSCQTLESVALPGIGWNTEIMSIKLTVLLFMSSIEIKNPDQIASSATKTCLYFIQTKVECGHDLKIYYYNILVFNQSDKEKKWIFIKRNTPDK